VTAGNGDGLAFCCIATNLKDTVMDSLLAPFSLSDESKEKA
jgi:hypothetical protein